MTELIKQMRDVLGDNYTNQIHIHILSDEIYFGIYENEIAVIVDLKGKEVYVDCNGLVHHLGSKELFELEIIVGLLKENLYVIEELFR